MAQGIEGRGRFPLFITIMRTRRGRTWLRALRRRLHKRGTTPIRTVKSENRQLGRIGASLSATRFRMAAALNAKPQPLAVDLSSYALQATTIQPTFLTLADIQRHYQGIDSDERSHSHDLLSFHVSSRSDSDSTLSPPSTRENVIVKHDSKRKKELVKDDAYWERRRKNNDAAKRSRDSRRQKEDEMASRAACLERENLRLRGELDHLRAETDQLRTIILTSAAPLALRGLSLPPFSSSLLTTPSVITPTGHCQLTYPDSTQRGTVLVTNYANPS